METMGDGSITTSFLSSALDKVSSQLTPEEKVPDTRWIE
jgi:hypothetical protein